MTIHPKKLRLIENIILSLICLMTLFIVVYKYNLNEIFKTSDFIELTSLLFIILIFVGLIYKLWNPKFLSFEKSIFEEAIITKSFELENDVFVLADYKIEKKDNIITLSRFGNNFNIIKTIINLDTKTLKHKPFDYLNIFTLISLNEIENFDVVFRPKRRTVLIYNTKFNKNFELKSLILDPISWKNKYHERKEDAKKIVSFFNNLL